jgi:hypothetical protein
MQKMLPKKGGETPSGWTKRMIDGMIELGWAEPATKQERDSLFQSVRRQLYPRLK